MIGVDWVRSMSRYNQWQNDNLYEAAGRLSNEERLRDRGAFFGSIHGTLSHLVWADRLWMHRFLAGPPPQGSIRESPVAYPDWEDLGGRRRQLDHEIGDWAARLTAAWLSEELGYFSLSLKRDVSGPRGLFVSHFFNHQTHHRGQVHCLLTQAGAPPKQDTDLVMMPA
ncbi:MAG: DinB family protein [Pseudomonadota bacterium]